jgi:hypothetical protein
MPRAAFRPVTAKISKPFLRPRNFTNQIKVYLAKALREFVNGGSEDTGGARVHMFYRVNTIVINISIGNPKLIDFAHGIKSF